MCPIYYIATNANWTAAPKASSGPQYLVEVFTLSPLTTIMSMYKLPPTMAKLPPIMAGY